MINIKDLMNEWNMYAWSQDGDASQVREWMLLWSRDALHCTRGASMKQSAQCITRGTRCGSVVTQSPHPACP